MTITLSSETQKLLEERMKQCGYRSADEAIHAALDALVDEHTLDDKTLDALDRAEDQIDRGEVHDWKTVREQVRAKFLGQ